jgi:3-(3-hydroxy-phenyl)propionate hydroxylase
MLDEPGQERDGVNVNVGVGINVDVVVVGAGPTGLLLTHLLAKQGVRVCLMEQLPQVVGEARAVSIDDESLRSLADAHQLQAFSPLVTHSYGVHYYSCLQTLFAKVEPHVEDYGHPKRNAFRQQDLVRTLFEGLSAYPHVLVKMSSKVLSYSQSTDANDANGDEEVYPLRVSYEQTERTPSERHVLRAKWMVGADGGRSTIRELMGSTLHGKTHPQRWLIAGFDRSPRCL